MAELLVGKEGSLNGTTAVTVVASPASAHQIVTASITIYNADTISHVLTLNKVKGATVIPLYQIALAANETLPWSQRIHLDATDESVTAVLGEAVGTTNPTYDTAALDVS